MTQGRFALVESPQGDILVSRGSDNEYVYQYGTQETGGEFVPQDWAGWDARAQLRGGRTPSPAALWLTLTTTLDEGTGIVLDDEGLVRVLIDHRETEKAAWWSGARLKGEWDLELVAPGGAVKRLIMGKVSVSPDVTVDVTA